MSVVDDIKDRLDIVEVIQSYVPLKKAGRNYKGLCPFHSEKTPSFVVFPHSGTWHCFGACGTGGDLFTFVMKRENLDFGEALKLLAQRAGVELEPLSPQVTEAEKRLELLRAINKAAALYFHHLLLNADEAARARAYLDKRGLSRETIDRFEVGYALDQWDGLLRYLTSKGYAVADLVEAGLAVEREDRSGYYDRFRGRIVFPIHDAQGRTLGFGGRILGEGVPKYLNSPQTPLFDKSSLLYGLDQAKGGIRASGEAVIVEGYMDVLIAHQYGLNNVVAQMGTALTEEQLTLLKRYSRSFILALDADLAGDQATLRGLDVARQVMDREVVPVPTPRGLIRFEERLAADIRIVSLPPGRDPDEVIRESPAHWAQLISGAKPVTDYYFDALTADLDLASAGGKSEAVRRLGPLLAELGDTVSRTHYLQLLARMVQVDERVLWQQIQQSTGRQKGVRTARPKPEAEVLEPVALGLDERFLALLLTRPALLYSADKALQAGGEAVLDGEDFLRAEDRVIWTEWRRRLESAQAEAAGGRALLPTWPELYEALDERLQARIQALVEAQKRLPELLEEALESDAQDMALRFRLRRLQIRVRDLRFLLEDPEDPQAKQNYGAHIAQLSTRIRWLQQAMNERSVAVRRQREDQTIRLAPSEG